MYLVTSFHNPSSENLSLIQRNQLYNLAVKYQLYIISDDVYEHHYFDESQRLPPLFYCSDSNILEFLKKDNRTIIYDNNNTENIISLFSFSKLVSPGWRMVN